MTRMTHTLNSISSCSGAYSTSKVTLPYAPIELRQDDRPESAPDPRVSMCRKSNRSAAMRIKNVIDIIREEAGL